MMHTTVYSFGNGLCECIHAIIDVIAAKMMAEQPKLSLKVALAWAVIFKNCLHMTGCLAHIGLYMDEILNCLVS